MKIKIIVLSIFMGVSAAHATTNSNVSTVTEITVGTTYARIKLASMTTMEGCEDQAYYYLDMTSGKNKEQFSAILATKATGGQIVIQATGCASGYPLISHIYLK
jgi:hypothetical protein